MRKRCSCGAYLSLFTDNYLLGTRPHGTRVYGKGSITHCNRCGYRSELTVTLLPWAKQQAEDGKLTLNPRWEAE